jgi:elongation factor P
MALSYTDLRVGTTFIFEGQPYEVLEFSFLRMQQRKAVAQVKMKNLINGKVITRNFHQSETFEEVEITKETVKYLYYNRDQYWFCAKDNPANRFFLTEEIIGEQARFLKPNTEVVAQKFDSKVINIVLPVKIDLKVKEAPPSDRGNTAQGGGKSVELETGAKISAPLFINTGDTIRVNTQTGEYVERVEKRS